MYVTGLVRAGRTLKLTDDLQKKICHILENGTSVKDTCALVGIGERTFYEWVAIGNAHIEGIDHARMPRKIAERERFSQFAQATTRARSKMRDDVVKSLVAFAKSGNVQAAMFLLERSDPENWGRQTRITHEYDLKQLSELKRLADSSGIPLSDIFERMIQRLAENAHSTNAG